MGKYTGHMIASAVFDPFTIIISLFTKDNSLVSATLLTSSASSG